jgi:hypothetical protein
MKLINDRKLFVICGNRVNSVNSQKRNRGNLLSIKNLTNREKADQSVQSGVDSKKLAPDSYGNDNKDLFH